MIRIICLAGMLCSCVFSFSQNPADSLTTVTVQAGIYKNDHCTKKLKRPQKKMVMFAFFNFYQDTISVFIEDRLVFHGYVSKDSTLVSTDFTGTMFGAVCPARKTRLSIVSAKNKIRVNSVIKRKYPLYTISLYEPKWYVSPRKCFPILK